MKITDEYVFFWTEYFSNWAFTENGLKLEVNGKEETVPTSEHLFMLFKAQYFNDEDSGSRNSKRSKSHWKKSQELQF